MHPAFWSIKHPVIILAGGRGERMRPWTDSVQKCCLTVAGMPFICWQVEWLLNLGLNEIVIVTGYREHDVMAATKGMGCGYAYCWGGKNEAIRAGRRRIGMNRPFFLLYGDVMPRYIPQSLPFTYSDQHAGVVGACGTFLDTGLSYIVPGMYTFRTMQVPRSLEIGSMDGYAETQRHLQGGANAFGS
jgi:MobA-like NTP transferase domain